MDPDFWLERWRQGQTGFHRQGVNPRLLEQRSVLPARAGARVFVPLCGKSFDLWWLAQQGYEVIGIELSEIAVQDFFREQDMTPEVTQAGPLVAYRASGITLYCGDFFALGRELLGRIDAFYDRAALVALPPTLRVRYGAHLSALTPAPVTGLLVAFEYAQAQMNGPPFAVSEAEIRSLYEPSFRVELLASHDILDEEPRFRQAGLSALRERVYKLSR